MAYPCYSVEIKDGYWRVRFERSAKDVTPVAEGQSLNRASAEREAEQAIGRHKDERNTKRYEVPA